MIEERLLKILITKEKELYDKTTQEKLDNAEYFKNEGNKNIQNKDYEKASFFY